MLGEHKVRDKDTLGDTRDPPSIYVGESARSLAERSKEHWGDYQKLKPETHMHTHWKTKHESEDPPQFNFRVIKSFRSALARQVAEAVRIQLRGSVLNVKGVYNRSKLTRLVVDEDWDKKVWKESWNANNADPEELEINENTLNASKKNKKRKDDKNPNPKRRKIGKDDMIMRNIQLSSEVVNTDNKGSPEAYERGKGVEHTIGSSAVKSKKSGRSGNQQSN